MDWFSNGDVHPVLRHEFRMVELGDGGVGGKAVANTDERETKPTGVNSHAKQKS